MSPPAEDQDKTTADAAPDATDAARAQVAKQDDATVMADTPHALTPQAVEDLKHKNELVEVDRNSISKHARDTNPAFQRKDANGNYLPVYVMPNVGDGKQTAIVVDLGNGKKAVIANEGIHDWSQDYADRHIRQSNADIAADKELHPAEQYSPPTPEGKERYQELAKHTLDAAQNNGIGETRILISDEPGVDDAYTITSKEGVNYVVIPRKEMDNALSSPEQTQRLEQAIDAQMPDVKKRDISLQATLADHLGDQYIASRTDKDNKITLDPKDSPQLSQASLDELVKEKALVPVKLSDLDPATREAIESKYGALPADTNLYVVVGANSDFKGAATPVAAQTTDPDHKPYVLIDERLNQQTASYVKEHVMSTEASVASLQVNGSLTDVDPAVAKQLKVPEGVQLLVSQDDTATSPYSFQTKEGKNYIVLPREDVADASKPNGNVQNLQHAIDEQAKSIQKGDTTPEGMVRASNAGKWMAENIKTDTAGRQQLPDPNTSIDNATLDNLIKTGRFIEGKPENLTPAAAAAIANAKGADGKPLPADTPVYIVPGVNNDGQDKQGGEVMHTSDGKYFILVNEKAHVWTKDDVQPVHDATIKADTSTPSHQKGLSSSEAMLQEVLQGKSQQEADAIRHRYDELMKAVQADGESMGASKEVVLIDNSPQAQHTYAPTGASSEESKEGTKYIFMTRDEFTAAITSNKGLKEEKAIMGHETSHNAHGDTHTENALAAHDLTILREHELRADLGGAGPLGTGDPLALAKTYEDYLLSVYNNDNKTHRKSLTDKQMKDVSQALVSNNFDPDHPSRWELIEALRHEDTLMKQYEKDYKEQHGHAISDEPPELQKQIRVAEAKQVEDQTVAYMKTRLQVHDDTPEIKKMASPSDQQQQYPPIEPPPPPADQPQQNSNAKDPPPNPQEAQQNKTQADMEHAKALFRMHSQQGAQNVDASVAGFAPSAVVAQNQGQERSVPS